MRRPILILLIALALIPVCEGRLAAQIERPLIGAGLGVVGGAAITIGIVVARAHWQREYLDSIDDLIHWQSTPMIASPIAGVVFGAAGKDALRGSVIGSTTGLVGGALIGAGIGWLVTELPEGPWAGAAIGGGFGLALGGLTGGLLAWSEDEDPDLDFPSVFQIGFSIPVP